MSNNQSHGKQFEDHLKAALFPGAADHGRSPTSAFDVEAQFNKERGVPCSIKTAKAGSPVCMADARRMWGIGNEPSELIVAEWVSEGPNKKQFKRVHRFLFTPEVHQELIGQVTAEQVERIHEGMKEFGLGQHKAARRWAREQKEALAPVASTAKITLNPKIDSHTQRRLQCSVKLADLKAATEGRTVKHQGQEVPLYEVYDDHVGTLCLPFGIVSSPRTFR